MPRLFEPALRGMDRALAACHVKGEPVPPCPRGHGALAAVVRPPGTWCRTCQGHGEAWEAFACCGSPGCDFAVCFRQCFPRGVIRVYDALMEKHLVGPGTIGPAGHVRLPCPAATPA
eukprot:10439569-Lingulodinium_polyedra.AAC.1